MFSLWPITEHKTHERGGSAAKNESKCLNCWAQILLRLLIFKLVTNNSIYLQNYQEHFQTETLGATAPSTCSRYPFRSVVPENIPKVHKKNLHSHSPARRLRSCNFVVWAKGFTWTWWLRFYDPADVSFSEGICIACCHPLKQWTLKKKHNLAPQEFNKSNHVGVFGPFWKERSVSVDRDTTPNYKSSVPTDTCFVTGADFKQ